MRTEVSQSAVGGSYCEKRLREVFLEIAFHHGLEFVELEPMPDHVYLFVVAPPEWAPGKIGRQLQGGVCRGVVSGVSGIAQEALGWSSLGRRMLMRAMYVTK